MTSPEALDLFAAVIFALAVIHTFSTRFFHGLAARSRAHAGVWHLLGEVEVVFGLWAMVLVVGMAVIARPGEAIEYLDSRNYTEPLFVFAIMVVAGSRAVLQFVRGLVDGLARRLPTRGSAPAYFLTLSLVPLLGSFITEPAAMTLAALMLRDRFLGGKRSDRFRYGTLGVLFVNISIGGVLTPFAAPPVLMVAATWGWDTAFMANTFGWKAACAVIVNAAAATWLARATLADALPADAARNPAVPLPVTLAHLAFLGGIVVFAHHPPVFLGLLLFFLGFATAYERHQDRLILREGLLVAFFLAGLVVIGGMQQWWLKPVLMGLDPAAAYWGAAALTAVTDNAALTYLASLVPGLSDEFKYAIVAGAVTGGGLTVIANAPNPAGVSILRERFPEGAIGAGRLLLAALPPTAVAAAAFLLL